MKAYTIVIIIIIIISIIIIVEFITYGKTYCDAAQS